MKSRKLLLLMHYYALKNTAVLVSQGWILMQYRSIIILTKESNYQQKMKKNETIKR